MIIFTPYWVSFPEFIRLSDAEPNFVKTISNKNFEPDFAHLQRKKDKSTKGVIINSPSNPTGGVWRDETIVKLLKVAKRNDWYVISDECYERLTYNKKFTSVEKLNRENKIGACVITCMSLSKTYAMTGWRIGYSVGPNKIIKGMAKIQGQATSCANSIGQKAGIAALSGDQECVDIMKSKFLKRRDLMLGLIRDIPNVTCSSPNGAFYVFPDFSLYLNKSVNGEKVKDTFDHKTVIDINDPKKDKLLELETHGLAQITQLDGVGAEKFAEHAFKFADKLVREITQHRCYCVSVECMEHGSISAIYTLE